MREITASMSRIWINPPAKWKTPRPNSQASIRTTNRIVKVLMYPNVASRQPTHKNHSGYALVLLSNPAHFQSQWPRTVRMGSHLFTFELRLSAHPIRLSVTD